MQRAKTLRRMTPEARAVATVANELELAAKRLRALIPLMDELHTTRTIAKGPPRDVPLGKITRGEVLR